MDPESCLITNCKRKLEEAPDEEMKKAKGDERNVLDFSDCVLTMILSYVKTYDLYCLSKTCTRFGYLVKERKLWKRVDILDNPMCSKKFKFFFENFNDMTETLLIRGLNRKEKTLTSTQFTRMSYICDNLTVLAIENQYINTDEIRLSDFPVTLEELSLRGTHVTGKQAFLEDAHKKLVNLHTLVLDECKWFHEHSLMALSKLVNLENLSLYNCRNLNDSIAYMSVTARFGFQKLLRIDARYTSIGDQFLKCFHCIKTLREIYLECPPTKKMIKPVIMDEIKKWCNTTMSRANVVIFNPGMGFKKSKGLTRSSRRVRRSDLRATKRNNDSDCLERGVQCNPATCGLMNEPVIISDRPPPTTFFDDLCQDYFEVNFSVDEAATPQDIYNPEELDEVLYCDDVSDSEEEIPDFGMFHSDVTDMGVQWFCTSDPQEADYDGQRTLLFKKPHDDARCYCKDGATKKSADDPAVPGPSGVQAKRHMESDDDCGGSVYTRCLKVGKNKRLKVGKHKKKSSERMKYMAGDYSVEEEIAQALIAEADSVDPAEASTSNVVAHAPACDNPLEWPNPEHDYSTKSGDDSTGTKHCPSPPKEYYIPEFDSDLNPPKENSKSVDDSTRRAPDSGTSKVSPKSEDDSKRMDSNSGPPTETSKSVDDSKRTDPDFKSEDDAKQTGPSMSVDDSKRRASDSGPSKDSSMSVDDSERRAPYSGPFKDSLKSEDDSKGKAPDSGPSKFVDDSKQMAPDAGPSKETSKSEDDSKRTGQPKEASRSEDDSKRMDPDPGPSKENTKSEADSKPADSTSTKSEDDSKRKPRDSSPSKKKGHPKLYRGKFHKFDKSKPHFGHRLGTKRVILKRRDDCDGRSPSITVDFKVGGPVHLEIINKVNEANARAAEAQPRPGGSREHVVKMRKTSEDKQVQVDNVEERAEAPQNVREARDRDLRVIIERLEPGLHIVIDREARIQFEPARDNHTKLKIFMARGYKMITDQALRSLMDIRLQLLDVTGTSVTENGIKEFLLMNPDCRVIHEKFCNCHTDGRLEKNGVA